MIITPCFAGNSVLTPHPHFESRGSLKIGVFCLLSSLLVCGAGMAAAQSKPATTTTLTIDSETTPVTSVASGTVVTLTAAVSAGSTAVTVGQVNFCDVSAFACLDIHRLGTAQLTSAGTAVMKFRPGPGNHHYKAVFAGTRQYAGSSSAAASLNVTGPTPSVTLLSQTGYLDYSLTATVYGNGSVAPSGKVSFLNASDANAVLGTASLANPAAGFNFVQLPGNPLLGAQPNSIAVGDFNRDGIPDLAILNSYSAQAFVPTTTGSSVVVLLGAGDGTFNVASTTIAPDLNWCCMAAGDFDGDGKLDLAIGDTATNTVTILLGNGDGTLTNLASGLATGTDPVSIAAADFNGDGIPDLAIANNQSSSITVLIGKGDGTFTSGASLQTGAAPFFVTTADFDGDGIPDLAVLNNNNQQNTLTVYRGNGDGTFTLVAKGPGTGTAADAIVVGDFNGDGIPDLAIATSVLGEIFISPPSIPTTNTVSVLTGNGDGTFTIGKQTTFTNYASAVVNVMETGDLNGDGNVDLVVEDPCLCGIEGGNMSTLLLGDGTGGFKEEGTYVGSTSSVIATGDWNGDGADDVAVTSVNGTIDNPADLFVYMRESQSATATVNGIAVPPATGTDQVVASYPGDSKYLPSASGAVALTAAQGSSQVKVTASSNPALYGTSETLTATVTGSGLPPTGSVTFFDGAGQLGTQTLTSGAATFASASFAVGSHSITASYPGDPNYTAGKSPVLTLTVQKGPPTETVTPAATRIPANQSLSVVVNVTGATGNPAPSGTVTLLAGGSSQVSGGQMFGPMTLVNQSATFTVPGTAFSAGQNTVSATYTPDAASAALYTGNTQSAAVFVTGSIVPGMTVTPSATVITDQQVVSIAVSLAATGVPPTGSVTLVSGSYAAVTSVSGSTMFTVPAGSLPDGTDTLTATYSGDGTYASSTGTATVTVSPVLMTASAPSPVSPGSNATATVTLTAGSYAGTMSLSCTLTTSPANAQNLPACSLNPASVTIASGGTATTALTLKTTPSSMGMVRPFPDNLWRLGEGALTLAGLLMFGFRARRCRLMSLLASLALLFAIAIVGCGGGHSTHTTPGTTAGTYVFTVTAKDAANAKLTTSATVSLTVQ